MVRLAIARSLLVSRSAATPEQATRVCREPHKAAGQSHLDVQRRTIGVEEPIGVDALHVVSERIEVVAGHLAPDRPRPAGRLGGRERGPKGRRSLGPRLEGMRHRSWMHFGHTSRYVSSHLSDQSFVSLELTRF